MGFFVLAIIAPFAALRFTGKAGRPAEYCCPPYHAVPPGGQALLYGISPYNAVRLEFPKDGAPEAAAALYAWRRDGILSYDDAPAFYLYRRSWQTFSADGLFVRLSYSADGTPPGPIAEDRRRMLDALRHQAGPVCCTYGDRDGAAAALLAPCFEAEPLCTFTLYHTDHTLWRLCDAALIGSLQDCFQSKELTAADNHLYQAASAFGSCLALLTGDAISIPDATHRYQPLTGLVMYAFS
jgi:uncharacterized protein (DUF1015 family)